MRETIRRLLTDLGEDPDRDGLRETPRRVEQSLQFLTGGYSADIDGVINGALFPVEYNEMVLVRDIDFYSLCEHHLLPFFGKCHIAYLPDGKVIGLSKIPRLVDVFARRLQVQERLTSQIAETFLTQVHHWASPSSWRPRISAWPCAACRSRTRSRRRARCSVCFAATRGRAMSSLS
jgi:GTP cyclohydrolase I